MEDTKRQEIMNQEASNPFTQAIGDYFVANPGCIALQYDEEQIRSGKLYDLEKYCQNPAHWFEVEEYGEVWGEPGKAVECTFREFWISYEKLEEHYFECDDDALKVYMHEKDGQILDIEVCCH